MTANKVGMSAGRVPGWATASTNEGVVAEADAQHRARLWTSAEHGTQGREPFHAS